MTDASTWPDSLAPYPATASPTCLHCGAAPAVGGRAFCCSGCEAAYALVTGLGLDQFYKRRRIVPGARPLRPDAEGAYDCSSYATGEASGRQEIHLLVDGITCAACVWLLESVLGDDKDVVACRVNLSTRRLLLRWEGSPADANRHVARAAALGFHLVPFDPARIADATTRHENELLKAMAVAGFAASNIMLLSVSVWAGNAGDMGLATRDLMHWASAAIALPTIAYSGRPFFRSALQALRNGRTNMDVPISIGVLLAGAMSLWETAASGRHAYFDSAVALLFFLLVGRYLDARSRGRARSAAEHLVSLSPSAVSVVQADGSIASQRADAVAPGRHVIVAAGERIGVDGRIESGRSDLDTSLVTGESIPVPAASGTAVFAGMVNLSAPLRVVVTATGSRTLLAEIVRLMEAAEQGRSRFVVLADRVARAYAPFVHTLAALTFIGWSVFADAGWQVALLNAVAVLIITCPCALALAVPVVQVVAGGRLLKQGILPQIADRARTARSRRHRRVRQDGHAHRGHLDLLPDPSPRTRRICNWRQVSPPQAAIRFREPCSGHARLRLPAADVTNFRGMGLSKEDPSGKIRLEAGHSAESIRTSNRTTQVPNVAGAPGRAGYPVCVHRSPAGRRA